MYHNAVDLRSRFIAQTVTQEIEILLGLALQYCSVTSFPSDLALVLFSSENNVSFRSLTKHVITF